ncbi:MAG: hypothetical protein AAFO07_18300 [Bacteroidota bacterium]
MNKSIQWILAFLGVFAIALVVLFVSGDGTSSLLNFPKWLWYFFGVEFLFCLVYFLFTKFYWRTDD